MTKIKISGQCKEISTKLEISKMLTINIKHITEETSFLLDECDVDSKMRDLPPTFNKRDYGWFIYVGDIDCYEMPKDLQKCCELAIDSDCDWLCFDVEGPVVSELEIYEWS